MAAEPRARTIHEMVSVRPLDPGSADTERAGDTAKSHGGQVQVFEGCYQLEKMGNAAPIAFGGCVLSQCVSAGFASLPVAPTPTDEYQLYSILGTFLGPGSTERSTQYHVRSIRDGRSLATRQVEAWQGDRRIMILLMDFAKPEKRSMFEYNVLPISADAIEHDVSPSAKPSSSPDFSRCVEACYSSPDALPSFDNYLDEKHDAKSVKRYRTIFPLFTRFFHVAAVPSGMGAQNALGIAAHRPTTQDHRPLTKRTNAFWYKIRTDSSSDAPSVQEDSSKGKRPRGMSEAALAFLMDGALAFLPLTFTHQFLHDAQACSSLELSLRFFHHPLSMDDWLLQEQSTEAGSQGRTFSTGRMWNKKGQLVAIMSQVGIMRPWPEDRERHKSEASKL